MDIPVFDINGNKKGKIKIEHIISFPVRTDLIIRAVLSERSKERQPYGTNKLAGKRTSAHYHGRRQKIRHSMMNREMARMARIHSTRTLYFTARFVPQARKGRKAHPPKAEKIWYEKINKKEWKKVLLSAIAASFDKKHVEKRGHVLDGIKHFPLVLEDSIEKMKKTKDMLKTLHKLGLEKELKIAKKRKRLGPLIVVMKDGGIVKAARNIAGVEIVSVKDMKVEDFAPGTHPGRIVVWSKSALEYIEKRI